MWLTTMENLRLMRLGAISSILLNRRSLFGHSVIVFLILKYELALVLILFCFWLRDLVYVVIIAFSSVRLIVGIRPFGRSTKALAHIS